MAKKLTPSQQRKKDKKKASSLDRVTVWNLFSKYIRLRDSLHVNPGSTIKCVTCGSYVAIKKSQAGHFQSRKYKNIKYDEMNVHAQCIGCNNWGGGEQDIHAQYILKHYGQEELDRLRNARYQHGAMKAYTLSEIVGIQNNFKVLFDDIVSKHGDPWGEDKQQSILDGVTINDLPF